MSRNCPNCNNPIGDDARYCRICGHEVYDQVQQRPRRLIDFNNNPLFLFALLSCVLVTFLLVVEVACLILNIGNVFNFVGNAVVNFILAIPYPTVIFSVTGAVAQAYWLILAVIICVCFVYALIRFGGRLSESMREKREEPVEHTGLFWVCVIMSAMMFVQVVYLAAIQVMGIPIDSSWIGGYSDTALMFLLADASVWEEIVTRVLYIGVPICIIALIRTRKPDSLKCLLGGFGMSKTALILIVASAVIFGLAHNEGWGVGKIFISGLMGVALGYLFVRFGLYASILLHFATNYMSSFAWLGIGGAGMVTFGLIALGIPAVLYICKKLMDSRGTFKELPLFSDPGSK